MKFTSPLTVYIIWHPEFKEGQEIAEFLYTSLCRDYHKPLVRSLGIPVFFRSNLMEGSDYPNNIDFEESEYTAIIPLISDELILDDAFVQYLESIVVNCESLDNSRIYPVALCKGAYSFSKRMSKINFIREDIQEGGTVCGKDYKGKYSNLKISILHELCRLMLKMKKAVDEENSLRFAAAPIKLFISHSKHDDSEYDALKFRDYINSQTQLKTFFDANDIAYGSNFGDEIKKAVKESALVAFQSDSYSEREWCRIEVLTAKSIGCPVVIVNAIKNGEKRTFPYMGNYPSIRYNENFNEIIGLTLEQVLFNKFTTKLLDQLTDLYEIKTDSILSTYPELYSFVHLKEKNLPKDKGYNLIIYPDPPLGSEEINLLNKLDEDYHFITPLQLPSLTQKK